jgi:hypothetical protein
MHNVFNPSSDSKSREYFDGYTKSKPKFIMLPWMVFLDVVHAYVKNMDDIQLFSICGPNDPSSSGSKVKWSLAQDKTLRGGSVWNMSINPSQGNLLRFALEPNPKL